MFLSKILRCLAAAGLAAIVLSGCSQAGRQAVQPEQDQALSVQAASILTEMDQSSQKMLELAKMGAIPEAREQLEKIGKLMTKINFNGLLSPDGMDALVKTVMDAQKTFNAVKFSPDQGMAAAVKVRLAVDALSHRRQPMWLAYERGLRTRLAKLNDAVQAQNRSQAIAGLAALYQDYQAIRAACLISGRETAVYKSDSLFIFMEAELSKSRPVFPNMRNGTKHFAETLDELFQKAGSPAYLGLSARQNPLYWTIVLGAIIMTVLLFAGWKKFQYGSPYRRIR